MKHFAIARKDNQQAIMFASYPEDAVPDYSNDPAHIWIELEKPLDNQNNCYIKNGKLLQHEDPPSQYHYWDVDTESFIEDIELFKDKTLTALKRPYFMGDQKQKVLLKSVWFNASAQAEIDLLVALQTNSFPQEWYGLDNKGHLLTQEEATLLLEKIRVVRLNFKKQYWALKEMIRSATKQSDVPQSAIEMFVAHSRV